MELEDKDLSFNYRTHCDPRLNYEQSLGESEQLHEPDDRRRFLDCGSLKGEAERRGSTGYLAFQPSRTAEREIGSPIFSRSDIVL
jgi:hypothetical protein